MSNDLGAAVLTLVIGFVAMAAFMVLRLRVAVSQEKLTVVDTAWGLGFVVIALASAIVAFAGDGDPALRWILLVMVALWGGRLAWHLHTRNNSLPEDPRYADLTERSHRLVRADRVPAGVSAPGRLDVACRHPRNGGRQ